MARRGNGEGSVTQRKDGRWQASIRLNGTRRTVYGKTEREARRKLREIQSQIDKAGMLATPGQRTVDDLVDTWLSGASNLKPSTIAQYRFFFDTYARPVLGSARLANITPALVQRVYAGLKPSVADKVYRILHRAFAVAVRWGWLAANPASRALRPAYKSTRPAMWDQAELDIFLAGTMEHWLYPLWLLLIATGLRLGEALALRWDNVSPDRTALTIAGTLYYSGGGQWIINTPKTPSAARVVALPPMITAALAVQRARQDAQRERAGGAWQEHGLIFTGEIGRPLYHSTIQHALKRECARLGLPAVTPHSLRHLHASLLIDSGVPITAIAARLGHASPQITMRLYAHALSGQDVAAAEAIARVLASTPESDKGSNQPL